MPSNRPPEPSPPRSEGESSAPLEAVEALWRTALGELHRDELPAAERAIEGAGEVLARLTRDFSADPTQLARHRERLARLQALHAELLGQVQRARTETAERLAESRRGRRALSGYAVPNPARGGVWA